MEGSRGHATVRGHAVYLSKRIDLERSCAEGPDVLTHGKRTVEFRRGLRHRLGHARRRAGRRRRPAARRADREARQARARVRPAAAVQGGHPAPRGGAARRQGPRRAAPQARASSSAGRARGGRLVPAIPATRRPHAISHSVPKFRSTDMSARPVRTVLRRVRVAAVALLGVLSGCSGGDDPAVAVAPSSGPHPDILIYLVDTLRADALGTYGATTDDSPAIDALAGQAAVFDNAVSQAPWTLPSVTSLLTSSYPPSHRILGKDDRVGLQADTLVEYLKAQGYHTVGFASNTMGGKGAGLDQGFDEFTEHQNLQRLMIEHEAEVTHPLQPLFDWAAAGYQGAEPLFLYVHTVEPHDPYEGDLQLPSKRYVGTLEERKHLLTMMHEQRRLDTKRFGEGLDHAESKRLEEVNRELARRTPDARDLYAGDVRQANDNFAHLIDLLSRSPRWKDTIVIFLSDHGEEFHEHGSWFHGHSVYQELLHVPLIMRVPGLTDGGRRIDMNAQLIDVLPTLADLIGGPSMPAWQGRSLL